MAEHVRITDVAPRDGLQNEPGVIPTEEKAELVRLLCETGVDEVEVTSFVSARWVPQLGDAAPLLRSMFKSLLDGWPRDWPMLSVLVPNEHGNRELCRVERDLTDDFQRTHRKFWPAADAKWLLESKWVDKISVFTAASETFNKRNTNASIAESIERFRPIIEDNSHLSRPVRGYVSCAISCPFEGPVHPQRVAAVVRSLLDIGVNEIDLGDTIGAADAANTVHLLEVMRDQHEGLIARGAPRLILHLHDTHGRAAECVKAALDLGVRSFDGAVGGLGGCPYASTPGKRAPGNISTQTLVRTIHDAGYTTGVDMDKLEEAGQFAMKIVGEARARGGTAPVDKPPGTPRKDNP